MKKIILLLLIPLLLLSCSKEEEQDVVLYDYSFHYAGNESGNYYYITPDGVSRKDGLSTTITKYYEYKSPAKRVTVTFEHFDANDPFYVYRLYVYTKDRKLICELKKGETVYIEYDDKVGYIYYK